MYGVEEIDPKHRLRHCLLLTQGRGNTWSKLLYGVLLLCISSCISLHRRAFSSDFVRSHHCACRSSSHPVPTPEAHPPPRLQTPLSFPPLYPASPATIVNKSPDLPAWLSESSLASADWCEAHHNSLILPYSVQGVRCVDRTFLLLSAKTLFLQHIPGETVYPRKRSPIIIKPSDSNCSRKALHSSPSLSHDYHSETASSTYARSDLSSS